MSDLHQEIAIKLAAINLGQVANFDANLFADEIIAKVLDSELASEKAKAWLDIRAAQERAKTIERVLEAIDERCDTKTIKGWIDTRAEVEVVELEEIRKAIKGVGDE